MFKKWIFVFLVFFLGTAGVIRVDQACLETTGCGGNLCPSIQRTDSGGIALSCFGLSGEIDL